MKYFYRISVAVFVLITTIIKLILVFKSPEKLSVHSDDINYYISAVYFLKKGVLTYRTFNEATVFIMPLYPLFLSGVLKIFGIGFWGLQAIRIIQTGLSALSILFVYLTAKKLFNKKAGLISAGIFSFYPPNLITPGYILTECLFTFLLLVLIYFSFKFADNLSISKVVILSLIWIIAVFCRPTVLFYPCFYLLYIFINKYYRLSQCIKFGITMALIFILSALPWWVRNYNEYQTFIPLTASSGNPLLQGTYINYLQTPDNTTNYEVGKTALETDNIERNVAYKRIREGFRNHFLKYLCWYTAGKTFYFWALPFYWTDVMGISYWLAVIYHIFIVITASYAVFKGVKERLFMKSSLIVFIALYFNFVHCVYMSFDRYAYPIIGVICIYCGAAFVSCKKIKNKF
ncbi:glycosyltransferase family 39 protein [Ruminiclostridium papyrosolvens]|uniref:Glycosyltransferase RgtA/B/C/D-like domain-containing protein n=1 Tax=Ruminiclostridium papyrosolvens C7 TaxID=1330534 RepID=U4R7G8_9FIRM|nr:glycosyltransferase family 39 protein [Ruminiclostridium papyrosolvens]EPR14445.1 hypothetical protein L323_01115 [Ruminiclostridium papyrosolvens C7]